MSHYIYINGLDDSESPYNIFRCGVCGIPWSEHPIGCPNHYNKSKYLQSLKYVLSDPQYSNLVALAVRNGFDLSAASADIARLPTVSVQSYQQRQVEANGDLIDDVCSDYPVVAILAFIGFIIYLIYNLM
jgi:hypothetical protein